MPPSPILCRAATSLLFSLATFGLYALLGFPLTPQAGPPGRARDVLGLGGAGGPCAACCMYSLLACRLVLPTGMSQGPYRRFETSIASATLQVVFTSLALFNVLLGPINAFPWVVNG